MSFIEPYWLQLGSPGSAVSSPSWVWAEPQRKTNLMHFSLKIWHLVAPIFHFPWLLQKNILPWPFPDHSNSRTFSSFPWPVGTLDLTSKTSSRTALDKLSHFIVQNETENSNFNELWTLTTVFFINRLQNHSNAIIECKRRPVRTVHNDTGNNGVHSTATRPTAEDSKFVPEDKDNNTGHYLHYDSVAIWLSVPFFRSNVIMSYWDFRSARISTALGRNPKCVRDGWSKHQRQLVHMRQTRLFLI